MFKQFNFSAPVALLALTLGGCGGSGGGAPAVNDPGNNADPGSSPTANTGVFIDSEVSGINYQTETLSGMTNGSGEFSYLDGESVTFSIGDIDFPPVAAGPVITPLDIFDTDNINDPSVVNMARLLQSLDLDGNPANGISIGEGAHQSATGMSLDLASPTFGTDADVINLVANSGSDTTTLIGEDAALAHLQDSLETAGLLPDSLIGSWYYDGENQTVVTFIDDTNYVVVQDIDEVGEPLCTDGMEKGTYTWNPDTAAFSLTNVIDTTGDCGLTSMQGEVYSASVSVSGNTLTLTDDEGAFPSTRVVAVNNPIVGSWLYSDSETTVVVTFIDDTNYVVAQDIDEIGEPLCNDGMESGTYTWDPETGEFSLTNTNDTTGDCGLTSVQGETYSAEVAVSAINLILTDIEGAVVFSRLPRKPSLEFAGAPVDLLVNVTLTATSILWDDPIEPTPSATLFCGGDDPDGFNEVGDVVTYQERWVIDGENNVTATSYNIDDSWVDTGTYDPETQTLSVVTTWDEEIPSGSRTFFSEGSLNTDASFVSQTGSELTFSGSGSEIHTTSWDYPNNDGVPNGVDEVTCVYEFTLEATAVPYPAEF